MAVGNTSLLQYSTITVVKSFIVLSFVINPTIELRLISFQVRLLLSNGEMVATVKQCN
jgi:hypothetical protein